MSNRVMLKSKDPNFEFWYEVHYQPGTQDWHDGVDTWMFYSQKIWPCVDGVFEVPHLIAQAFHHTTAVFIIRKYGDLSDPNTRTAYDAVKQGSSAVTTQLVTELLPTCNDYVPSKD